MKQAATNKKYAMLLITFIIVVIAVYFASELAFGFRKATQTPSSTLTTTVSSSNNNVATNFSIFENNLETANQLAILANWQNGHSADVENCTIGLVEAISGNKTLSSVPVWLYIINNTACTYSSNSLGSGSVTTLNTTPSACLNMTESEPRIILTYNYTNRTIVTPKTIYIYGTYGAYYHNTSTAYNKRGGQNLINNRTFSSNYLCGIPVSSS